MAHFRYQKYGDVVYLSVFSQGIVVLNSLRAALRIMGTKEDASAGRPVLTMAADL